MKIGSRITITTVTLVMITLGLYGYLSVRVRRAELRRDLERQTALVGHALKVAFEAAVQDGLFEDLPSLIRRWQEREPGIGVSYIDLIHRAPGAPPPGFAQGNPNDGGEPFVPPPPDPSRAGRLARIDVDGDAVGEHIELDSRALYALTIPVFDKDDKIVGALDLVRDESDAERALMASVWAAVFAIAGLSLGLALLVWLSSRAAITAPLKRLVEAIDDVTRGDLGRVILRERDDEVGDLAERFNEMTKSLREAREQILDGVDAKLALEARLRFSEKLATIGQLAASIAHEVGTPLNVIVGRARNMEKKADDREAVAKNASIIAEQTQRITRIIQQLLDFARRKASERTAVNVHDVAKSALDFLEHQLQASRVEWKQLPFSAEAGDGVPGSPVVTADADQIQQVILNLILNAIQAMPQGGQLEISTRALVRRRPGLDAAAPGHFVVLEVADTGVGIPPEDVERIFEPFYSTKSPTTNAEGGTGLGLSVSHGIVKDHDGWIECESLADAGTIFRVFLPAAD
jgi:signal transduction histidine kinase